MNTTVLINPFKKMTFTVKFKKTIPNSLLVLAKKLADTLITAIATVI